LLQIFFSCFERVWLVQEMNRWIATIEEIISAQLGSDDVNLSPDSANGNSPYQQIISVPGNNICADCSGHGTLHSSLLNDFFSLSSLEFVQKYPPYNSAANGPS